MEASALLMDRMVKEYVGQCPECMIINVDSDDARFSRVDNGSIVWHTLEKEPLDPEWIKEITMSRPQTLMIVEGFALSHTDREVKKLLGIIGDHFMNVTVFLELGPGVKGRRFAELAPAFEWKRDVNTVTVLKESRMAYRLFGWMPWMRKKCNRIAVLTR